MRKGLLKAMFRLLKNSKGYTLIELLAVVVILAIVSILIANLTITAISKYREIAAENALRDEADLIISQVYNNIYKLKESSVCDITTSSTSGGSVLTYLQNGVASSTTCTDTATKKLGLTSQNEITLANGQVYRVLNSNIRIESFQLHQTAPGYYEINLTLRQVPKNVTRKFNNQVRTIYDL